MDWFAVAGSWRKFNHQVELNVRSAVTNIIRTKNGIVSGGALGVDYITAEAAMATGNRRRQLRVIIPTR